MYTQTCPADMNHYHNNMIQLNVGLLSLTYDASVVYLDSYKKMLDATYGYNLIWLLSASHQELGTSNSEENIQDKPCQSKIRAY